MICPYLWALRTLHNEFKFRGLPTGMEDQPLELQKMFVQLRGTPIRSLSRTPVRDATDPKPGDEPNPSGPENPREREADPFDPDYVDPAPGEKLLGVVLGNLLTVYVGQQIQTSQRSRLPPTVILGAPGSGKSSLLRYLVVKHATVFPNDDAPDDLLPIFVSLRQYQAHLGKSIAGFAALNANAEFKLSLPEDFFERAMNDGGCLVCLDGADEVADETTRGQVMDRVRNLALSSEARTQNVVAITSRVAGYRPVQLSLKDFRHYRVKSFDDDNIKLFIQQWYTLRDSTPGECERNIASLTERLFAKEGKAILSLIHI